MNNTLSFTENSWFAVDAALAYNTGIGSTTGSINTKTGSSFNYSNITTLSTTYSAYYDETYTLDSSTSRYCPDGFSMSLGLYGIYYVYEITATEYTHWWWGTYVTQGTTENTKITVVESNESNLSLGFVYMKDGISYHE